MLRWATFGHNTHGPKSGAGGGAAVPLSVGDLHGSPSNTMLPGPRPTSVPSAILIHPAVWPQYTTVTERQDRQRCHSRGRTVACNGRPTARCTRVARKQVSNDGRHEIAGLDESAGVDASHLMTSVTDGEPLLAVASSFNREHTPSRRPGPIVVDEVVCEQYVERGLVIAVTSAVLLSADKPTVDVCRRRYAVSVQRAEVPPTKHVVVQLPKSHRTDFVCSKLTTSQLVTD